MKSASTKLNKVSKRIYNSHKDEIEDIVIFGSCMKGKEKPEDIDILMIFRKKVNKQIEVEFRKSSGIPNLDINSTTLKELKGDGFIAKEGLYLEGKSLVTGIKINESLGFGSIAFLKYNLDNTKGSERVKFYYALQGRGKEKGFLATIGAKRYAESVIICDYSDIENLRSFFDHWNIEYRLVPALIPKRLKSVLFKSD